MFNYVESKVVETTETPNGQSEQSSHFDRRCLNDQEQGGKGAQTEEQKAFQLNPERTGEIFHAFVLAMEVPQMTTDRAEQRPTKSEWTTDSPGRQSRNP